MSRSQRRTIRLATSTGILGLTVTSGLALLANYFVEQFSHPHESINEAGFTWSLPTSLPEPPLSCQRALMFRTVDGTLLCGDFWAQSKPAPTVVLCHGYRISRQYLRSVAALEYTCGYNVLLFDFRGHGESESVMTSGGNAEVCDLEAAIVVATRQPETLPGKIILHGFSMGAAVTLLTPPHPAVVAIIADSPYARSDDILQRIVCYQLTQASNGWLPILRQLRHLAPAVAWAIIAASTIVFRVRFGYAMVARPDTSFRRWQAHTKAKTAPAQHSIPILLIHSSGDQLIPIAHSRQIAAEAKAYGVPLETYFIDEAPHCGAYDHNPHEYHKAILDFLSCHLGDDLPPQHRTIL